jgi:DNA modification methylase
VFRGVKRVLRDDGTLWINLGDSYAGSGKGRNADGTHSEGGKQSTNIGAIIGSISKTKTDKDLKPKDLVGIPWMVAFALRADGWYLRSDIIWHKPNPMPESVTDRPTKAHEYIFLLSKSSRYYYDIEAIKEIAKESSVQRLSQDIENQTGSQRANGGNKTNGTMKAVKFGGNKADGYGDRRKSGKEWNPKQERKMLQYNGQRPNTKEILREQGIQDKTYIIVNKRSVWTVATVPFKGSHFATFPPKLIEPCILAGCPKDGIVLDPFMGSGTTAMVAKQNQRNYIGFELNPKYIKISDKRTADVQLKII